MIPAPQSTAYGWLMLAAVLLSVWFWSRLARRDDRLLIVYIAALVSAFLGAKAVYLLADGWRHFGDEDRWLHIATGKSILGALIGGYAGVEIAKKLIGYGRVTGDWFALVAPLGIVVGRIGCLVHGCCLGKPCEPAWFTVADAVGTPRWPSVSLEISFNILAIAALMGLRKGARFTGQHFHLYLMAYGLFRFGHEFARDTPRLWGEFSGYHLAALAVFALGLVRFTQRQRQTTLPQIAQAAQSAGDELSMRRG